MQYVFLGHDVDWRKQGPEKKHILERKERFTQEAIDSLDTKNPYYNFPEIMDIEDSLGIKSSFFFRTIYENGDYLDYENEITDLITGGWEVGLHLDPQSVLDYNKIQDEKTKLELLTKNQILANRVHYLNYDQNLPEKLKKLGFVYDSSTRHSKDQIDEKEMGYSKIDGIYEFPITLMDAYLFTHMKIHEDDLVSTFQKTLNYSRSLRDNNILTMIWHDNVLQMKGGRKYKDIMEFLVSQNDVKVMRGIDVVEMLNNTNSF